MGWEHIDTIFASGNKERVGKRVFQDEDMDQVIDVKKSYTDAVKSNNSKRVHFDSSKKHLPQNSNKAIKQPTNIT